MSLSIVQAYRWLLRIEWYIWTSDLQSIHQLVRHTSVRSRSSSNSPEQLCYAVETACAFYAKTVLCLQRSAAATLLLRNHGYSAELVIGAQILPLQSHAWVEMDGKVVNDKPYIAEIYQVLERC